MIVLIDMDGVLCDFDALASERFHERFPGMRPLSTEERSFDFYLAEAYSSVHGSEAGHKISSITQEAHFFSELPMIAGAKEALEALRVHHDVFLCTSPLSSFQHCVLEKFQWVEKNLGQFWTSRIILTKDKTLVKGDILIDDRPHIEGVAMPEWKHVLFTQPFNVSVPKPRINNWTEWPTILTLQ